MKQKRAKEGKNPSNPSLQTAGHPMSILFLKFIYLLRLYSTSAEGL